MATDTLVIDPVLSYSTYLAGPGSTPPTTSPWMRLVMRILPGRPARRTFQRRSALLHDGLAILDSHAKGDDQEILAALSIVRNFLQFADGNSTATMVPNQQDDPGDAPWFAPRLFSPP
jgi:hypothetical protein